jgi:hypothetical protein
VALLTNRDVLDLGPVPLGRRGGLARGGPALTGIGVRRMPIWLLMPRRDCLESAVTLSVSRRSSASPETSMSPRQPGRRSATSWRRHALPWGSAMSARLAYECPPGSRAAPAPCRVRRTRPRRVGSAADQVLACDLDVVDDEDHALERRPHRRALAELDRGGRAGGVNCSTRLTPSGLTGLRWRQCRRRSLRSLRSLRSRP